MNLAKLVPTNTESMTAVVEYRDGIKFKLRFISRSTLSRIGQLCVVWKYNDKTRQRQQHLDNDKYAAEFCRQAVIGWEGVTLRKLANLMPLDLSQVPAEDQDKDLPFDVDNLLVLVKNAYELDNFLQDTAVDIKMFRPALEEELGNSPSSPTGT